MINPAHASSVRGHGFTVPDSLQRAAPALPPPVGDSVPPGVWDWLLANPGLVRHAARLAMSRYAQERLSNLDLIGTVAGAVGKAWQRWRPDGGAGWEGFALRAMRNTLANATRRLYGCPGVPRDARRPPVLLGGYTPEPPEYGRRADAGPDRGTAEMALDAFAGLEWRRRQVVAMFLGMGGPRRSVVDIGITFGVSTQRASQLIQSGLVIVRRAAGVRDPVGRRLYYRHDTPDPDSCRARKRESNRRCRLRKEMKAEST